MTLITSLPNKSPCDVCGARDLAAYQRTQTARNAHMPYALTRRHRRRIDPTYWNISSIAARLGEFTTWQGKRVCDDCFAAFSAALRG